MQRCIDRRVGRREFSKEDKNTLTEMILLKLMSLRNLCHLCVFSFTRFFPDLG